MANNIIHVQSYLTNAPILEGTISNDVTLHNDSSTSLVTEHATKTYTDNKANSMSTPTSSFTRTMNTYHSTNATPFSIYTFTAPVSGYDVVFLKFYIHVTFEDTGDGDEPRLGYYECTFSVNNHSQWGQYNWPGITNRLVEAFFMAVPDGSRDAALIPTYAWGLSAPDIIINGKSATNLTWTVISEITTLHYTINPS